MSETQVPCGPSADPARRDALLRAKREMEARLDRCNPGERLSWWIAEGAFRLPERVTRMLADCGPALAAFFGVANDLYVRHASVRRRLEKRVSPHYRVLNRCQPRALPRLLRPDVVCDAQWTPKFVELEITVGARADTVLMARQYGVDPGRGLLAAYGAMACGLREQGKHLALVTAPHPFFQDLPDDARAFAALLEEQGAGPITVLTAENLALLRFDGRRLRLHDRYGPPREIHVIDRFLDIYEIAELQHPGMGALLDAYAAGAIEDVNTCKQFLDEKDWMSLFWEPALRGEWRDGLGVEADDLMRQVVPRTWIVRPDTVLSPAWGGELRLGELPGAPPEQRAFVLKESGTSTTASGAQSFHVLHTLRPAEVGALLQRVLSGTAEHVIQELIESPRIPFWALDPETDEVVHQPDARVKLSPFYVDGRLTDIRLVASNRKYAVNDEACVVGVVDW